GGTPVPAVTPQPATATPSDAEQTPNDMWRFSTIDMTPDVMPTASRGHGVSSWPRKIVGTAPRVVLCAAGFMLAGLLLALAVRGLRSGSTEANAPRAALDRLDAEKL